MVKETESGKSGPYPAAPYYGSVAPYGGLDHLDDNGFNLFDVWALFRRRWEIIVSAVAIGTIAAYAYGTSRVPIYQATAALLIEPDNKVVDLDSVVEGLGSDSNAIATQMSLIQSRGFLEDFIRTSYQSELLEWLAEEALASVKSHVDESHVRGTAVAATPAQTLRSTARQDFIANELGRLAGGLSVAQQGRSYIINVTYASPDPLRAEQVANGIAQHYIAAQTDRRREITGEASRFLEDRLVELKEELITAEQAVQTYRATEALHSAGADNLTSEQLNDLTTLVVRTRADRKEKETRLQFIERLRRSGAKLESVTEVLNSPYMVTLWGEASALRSRETELTLEFGANHPKIRTLRLELEELDGRITDEIDRIIANARNEVEVLKRREESLNEDMNKLIGLASDDAAVADKASIKLRILEGEAAASRRMFEDFLIRFKETREQEAVVQANARMVTRAQIPSLPSGRTPMSFVLIGFVGSAVAGFGLAFLRDRTDRTLKGSKETAAKLDLPCLGQVPYMSKRKSGGRKLHEYLKKKPVSAYAESIRSIYTKIWMQDKDDVPKVIQITSSVPAEGKTTFAVSLATLLAIDGKRILLLDLDLRHPSVGREIEEIKDTDSLDQFLRGDIDITTSMIYECEDGCDVIGVKASVQDPATLIRSNRLKKLIEKLSDVYDHIIIDSAPSLGLSDSKATFVCADTILFVVQWNSTSIDDAVDAIDELRSCNAELCGVVLTQVHVKKQHRYGGRGLDQYYSKNESYYQN